MEPSSRHERRQGAGKWCWGVGVLLLFCWGAGSPAGGGQRTCQGGPQSAAWRVRFNRSWTVFRQGERAVLQVTAAEGEAWPAGTCAAQVVRENGQVAAELGPGQRTSKAVEWTVDCGQLEVGRYQATVSCSGKGGKGGQTGEQKVDFEVRQAGARLLPAAPAPGAQEKKRLLRVVVIDVNNGHFVCESLLIVTPGGKTMLIDAAFPSGTFSYGKQKITYGTNVVPAFLLSRGIKRLDWMMLSHPHDDHIGDMPALVRRADIEVGEVLWSPLPAEKLRAAEPEYAATYIALVEDLKQACQEKHVPMRAVREGEVFDLGDGVRGEILAAAQPDLARPNYINNNSIIMRLTYGDFSMMFTGDAGWEQENRVLALGRDVTCDVLKIGHHAGAGSTSKAWMRAVAAKVGVASMPQWLSEDPRGKRVYEQLRPTGMRVYRTWEYGNIEVETDGRRFWVVTQRAAQQP